MPPLTPKQFEQISQQLQQGERYIFLILIYDPYLPVITASFQRDYHIDREMAVILADIALISIENAFEKEMINNNEILENMIENTICEIADEYINTDPKLRSKNLGLTKSEFEQYCRKFKQGDEALTGVIFKELHPKCHTYLKSRFKHIDEHTRHEAFLDALEAFRTMLLKEKLKYGNLNFLFLLITKQSYIRQNDQVEADLPETIFELPDLPDNKFPEEAHKRLEYAWSKLCQGCRGLLHNIYYEGLRAVDLVEKYGYKNKDGIGKKKFDCLEKLRKHFFEKQVA